MAIKKSDPVSDSRTTLLVSKEKAESDIRDRITKGYEILNVSPDTESNCTWIPAAYKKWNDFNLELLGVLFSGHRMTDDYKRHAMVSYSWDADEYEVAGAYLTMVNNALNELESIIERLSLLRGGDINSDDEHSLRQSSDNRKIFVVHGHDAKIKSEVARFLEQIRLSFIILHEQPNQGRTIIEKFEKHSDVIFAVVLLTPDDFGGIQGEDSRKRARQNVILELGYFLGRLGRTNVCALYAPGVELPSDLAGILYVPFDERGAWKYEIAREIKAAGIGVDMNLAI